MHADDVPAPVDGQRELLDVQCRGWWRGRRWLAVFEHPEDPLFQRHVLEHRLDKYIRVAGIPVVQRPADQGHAARLFVGRDAAPLDHAVIGLLHCGDAPVQAVLRGIEQRHRQSRVGEADRDAAAHRAGADDRGLPDRAWLRRLGNAGDLSGFALRKENMDQSLRLRRGFECVDELRLVLESFCERHRRGGGDGIDGDQGSRLIAVAFPRLVSRALRDFLAHGGDRTLAGPPGSGEGARVGDRGGTEIAAVENPVENSLGQRLRCVDRPRGEHELEGLLDPDQPRHALGAARARDDPQRDLGKSEPRARRRHPVVAGEGDLEPAAHHGPVHGGDDGERQALDRVEQAPVLLLFRRRGKFADVGPGKKGGAFAQQHRAPQVLGVLQLLQRGEKAFTDFCIDGVDGRIRDRDDGDPGVAAYRYDAHCIPIRRS